MVLATVAIDHSNPLDGTWSGKRLHQIRPFFHHYCFPNNNKEDTNLGNCSNIFDGLRIWVAQDLLMMQRHFLTESTRTRNLESDATEEKEE